MQSFSVFSFFRAHGIFWEPGVFSFFVNIYCFINYFILKNIKSTLLTIPALLLAWSTTGLLVFLLQSFIFLKDYKRGVKQITFKKYVIGVIALFFLSLIFTENYSNKIEGKGKGSAAQRYIDTIGAINVIIKNPIIGVGVEFKNFERQMRESSINFSNSFGRNFKNTDKSQVYFSNSFLQLFVYFGMVIGLILLYALYRQTLLQQKNGYFY